MKQTRKFVSRALRIARFIAAAIPAVASAGTIQSTSQAGAAFARYVASIGESNPFTDSPAVAVVIEGCLPDLHKETRVMAIRGVSETERSTYSILQITGDAFVAQEVISRYLKVLADLEDLPLSSVATIPKNYSFHYKGEIGTGSFLAHVYRISPRRKGAGLIEGELWIDAATGAETLWKGRFVKPPAGAPGHIEIVRDTTLIGGSPGFRVTHVAFDVPNAGRGTFTMTEMPLASATADEQRPASSSSGQ